VSRVISRIFEVGVYIKSEGVPMKHIDYSLPPLGLEAEPPAERESRSNTSGIFA
jgi:hypothetical protein